MQNALKKFRLSLNFYRSILPFNISITLACCFLEWKFPDSQIMGILIFFKLLTLVLSLLFSSFLRKNEFYYYYNLGISKIVLGTVSFVVDLFLFAVALSSTISLLR